MNIHAFGIIKGVSDKGDASRSEDKDEVLSASDDQCS